LAVTLTSLLPLFSPPVQELTPGWLAQLYVPPRTMISSPGFEAFAAVAIVFLGVVLLSPSLLSLPVAETYRQTPDPVGWHGVADRTGIEENNKKNSMQSATRIVYSALSP